MADKKKWWEKAAEKAKGVANKAGDLSGDLKERAVDAASDLKNSEALGKAKEGFGRAVEGASELGQSAVQKLSEVDWQNIGDNVKGVLATSAEAAQEGLGKLDSSIKSGDYKAFTGYAADNLDKLDSPVANAVVDSLGDNVSNPELVKRVIGVGMLVSGGNITEQAAIKIMQNSGFAETLTTKITDALPEGQRDNIEALKEITNGDLAQVMRDPDVSNVMQVIESNPEVLKTVSENLESLKAKPMDTVEPELNGAATKLDATPQAAPILGQ